MYVMQSFASQGPGEPGSDGVPRVATVSGGMCFAWLPILGSHRISRGPRKGKKGLYKEDMLKELTPHQVPQSHLLVLALTGSDSMRSGGNALV